MTTFREQMKGFPVWQMVVVSLIRFSEPISFTSLFPYVYFMVRDFGVAKDPTDISRYTGYMGGSFAFAQFLCCIHWGRLSDRVGRKRILLCGLLGSATSLLTFGFSKNYYMALFARTLMGVLNGNVAVLQTMVGEIATDRRHQPLAFSVMPLLWNLGCVVGPLIGGSKYLTRPKVDPASPVLTTASKNAWDRLLDKYPYSGSNIVVASLLCTSCTIGFLFLEETHYKARKKYDVGLATGDWIRRKLGFFVPVRPWETVVATEDETTPLVNPELIYEAVDDGDEEASISSHGPISRRTSIALIRRYSSAHSLHTTMSTQTVSEDTKNLFKAFRNRTIFPTQVLATMVSYFSLSFHSLIYSEFLPVLLAGKLQPDQLHFPWRVRGGFSWNSADIGTLLSSTGFVGCFVIIVVYPYLDRHVKTINGFRFACAVFPIAYFALPYVIFTLPEYNAALKPWVSTVALYGCSSLAILGLALGFPLIAILTFRATNPKHRAFVNSATMSATALARCLAPLLWGALISFFDRLGVGQVSWNLLALIALAAFVLALNLGDYDEDLKENEEE